MMYWLRLWVSREPSRGRVSASIDLELHSKILSGGETEYRFRGYGAGNGAGLVDSGTIAMAPGSVLLTASGAWR